MDNNERCEFMATELKRKSNFTNTRSDHRTNDILYKSVLALTSESLLREIDEECIEKIDTKGIVFDNFILVLLEELQKQNPQLKDEIEKLSDSHKQNICKRDYHPFLIAEKLNLPKRFVMYMNKAQEWGLEKELIYLIMAGYDEKTAWKWLVGYEKWIEELSSEEFDNHTLSRSVYASIARNGLPSIEEYIRWKTTGEVSTGEVSTEQTVDDVLDSIDDALSDILD